MKLRKIGSSPIMDRKHVQRSEEKYFYDNQKVGRVLEFRGFGQTGTSRAYHQVSTICAWKCRLACEGNRDKSFDNFTSLRHDQTPPFTRTIDCFSESLYKVRKFQTLVLDKVWFIQTIALCKLYNLGGAA